MDSSVVVWLYLQDDSQHEKSRSFFDLHSDDFVFVFLESILREVITVLTQKGGFEVAMRFVEDTEYLPIEIIHDSFDLELRFFLELQRKISFFDASLLYYADRDQIPLITFDEQLRKIYTTKTV